MLQLNPTMPVHTKLGKGRAILIIDYGMDINTCWVVALNSTGKIKHFDSNDVVIEDNRTYGTTSVVPESWVK